MVKIQAMTTPMMQPVTVWVAKTGIPGGSPRTE